VGGADCRQEEGVEEVEGEEMTCKISRCQTGDETQQGQGQKGKKCKTPHVSVTTMNCAL